MAKKKTTKKKTTKKDDKKTKKTATKKVAAPKKAKVDAAAIPKQKEIAKGRTRAQSDLALKKKVRNFYDLQRLRLQTGGRGKKKGPGADIQLHEGDLMVLDLRADELHNAEKNALKDIAEHLKTIPFYRDVLSDKVRFRGIGPTMAGVILSEFDIFRQDTPSSMWSFCGLAPIPAQRCNECNRLVTGDGKDGLKHVTAQSRGKKDDDANGATNGKKKPKKAACSKKTLGKSDVYDSGKAMRPTRGEKLRYNAFLRSKLCGVLGPVMLQVGSPWRSFYDNYKHRKQSAGWGTSDAHRHAASIRYMIKMLLLEIWKEWRAFEGLEVRPPYQEEYLGHKHNGKNASRQHSDNRSPSASQIEHDNHVSDASHANGDNQRMGASHQEDDFRSAEISAEIEQQHAQV